jgi:hypothetical protein
MAIATTKQRQYMAGLNQGRGKNIQRNIASNADVNDPPNIVVTILFLGLAFIGDLVGLIPLFGCFVRYPVLGAVWLWRFFRGQTGFKKDPTLQILLTSAGSALPFTPTCIVLVLYTHGQDTKLGKATLGKLSAKK